MDFQSFAKIFQTRGKAQNYRVSYFRVTSPDLIYYKEFLQVNESLFCLINTDNSGSVSVQQIMDFILEMTRQRYKLLLNLTIIFPVGYFLSLCRRCCDFNSINFDYIDEYFRDNRELTKEEFQKMIPCKNVIIIC